MQGVLRIKFAKTINLAVACSQFVEYYATKALLPLLTPFVASEFVHWLPTWIASFTRALFVYFAWKLQEVVSAAQSAMRGGLMCSRGVLRWLNKVFGDASPARTAERLRCRLAAKCRRRRCCAAATAAERWALIG